MEAAKAVELRRAKHLMLATREDADDIKDRRAAPIYGAFYQRPARVLSRLFPSFGRSRHRRNRVARVPVHVPETEPLAEIERESAPMAVPLIWSAPTRTSHTRSPCPRSGHVAVLVGNVYQYVYGGYARGGVDGVRFPEMWRYHVLTEVWEKVEARGGQPPAATCSQSAVLVHDKILFFGGTTVPFGTMNANDVTMFSLATNTWTTIDVVGDKPSPRFGQAVALDATKENLWVIGGTDGHTYSVAVFICFVSLRDLHKNTLLTFTEHQNLCCILINIVWIGRKPCPKQWFPVSLFVNVLNYYSQCVNFVVLFTTIVDLLEM